MRVIAILMMTFLFASCAKKKEIGQFDSRADVLEHIQNLSPQERSNFFKLQAQWIDTALGQINDQTIYFSFSMGLSSGDTKEVNWDTVDWNRMDIQNNSFLIPSPDTLKSSFNTYANTLKAIQHFGVPHSTFELDGAVDVSDIGNVTTSFKQLYQGKTLLDSSKSGLLPISEALVQIQYQLPQGLDSLIITPDAKIVKFMGYDLAIDTIGPQGMEIDLPMELYYNYLGHRGLTPNDKLVESNSYSAMPLYGLHPEIQKKGKAAAALFQKFSTAAVEDGALGSFESQFTEAMFQNLQKISYYQSTILKELKVLLGDNSEENVFDVIKKLREYIATQKDYLGPVEQRLTIAFPYPVKQFILYFGKSTESINTERRIPVSRSASIAYMTYRDENVKKYGIVDSTGKIIIEPRFKELERSSQDYFFDPIDSIDYFLNVKDKKLEPVKSGYRFERNLGDNVSVFKNKKDYVGVLRNGQEEIVPFNYTAVEKKGKLLAAMYTLRGRLTYDLYTLKGERLETPLLSEIGVLADSNLIVRNKLHKFGVIDTRGKQLIPMEYENIENLRTANLVYATKGNEKFLLNYQNKRTDLPADIRDLNINRTAEGMIPFSEYDKGYGYLNANGQVVIAPQYDYISSFYKGRALVRNMKGENLLIDKQNRILKKIIALPSADVSQNIAVYFTKDGVGYFAIGETILDENANIVKIPLSDLN